MAYLEKSIIVRKAKNTGNLVITREDWFIESTIIGQFFFLAFSCNVVLAFKRCFLFWSSFPSFLRLHTLSLFHTHARMHALFPSLRLSHLLSLFLSLKLFKCLTPSCAQASTLTHFLSLTRTLSLFWRDSLNASIFPWDLHPTHFLIRNKTRTEYWKVASGFPKILRDFSFFQTFQIDVSSSFWVLLENKNSKAIFLLMEKHYWWQLTR